MQYTELLGRVQVALERGEVRAADVERLMDSAPGRKPDAASILTGLGLAVAFAGAALLYGVQFDTLSRGAKLTTPFVFPLLALAAAVWAARTGRPRWQYEAAGMVAQLALGIAFFVVEQVLDPVDVETFGAICALIALVEVAVCHRVIGSVRLTGWGLSASIVALVFFTCESAGDDLVSVAVIVLLEGIAAAALAAVLLLRNSDWGVHAARTAALLLYGSALIGAGGAGWESYSPWHVVISVAVVATFLTAALFRLDALVWVGALGGAVWLGLVSAIAVNSGGAGVVVIAGLGLSGLGLLVARMHGIVRQA